MQVSNIVDNEAEGKGPLITDFRELLSYFHNVLRTCLEVSFTLEKRCQVRQCGHDVYIRLNEVKIVKSSPWLVQVGLIDEVPRRLPAAERFFDVIGECGAFSKRVVSFVDYHVRVRVRQGTQFSQRLLQLR